MARKAKDNTAQAEEWAPDDTTARDSHRLAGLEPDNLLAFMALLGLLRALGSVRPAWRPRAFWDVAKHPWRPVLTLAAPQTEAAIAAAAAERVQKLATAHEATGTDKDLRFTAANFTQLRNHADEAGREVLDALGCDAAIRTDKSDQTLWPTPFAFMFGQGHQHFLERLRNVPAGLSTGSRAKPENLSTAIAAALFGPWRRADKTDGFRWDPVEDRRYALRAQEPSTDPATTEHGANLLAAIALPLLPVTPIRRRGKARVLTPMTSYGPGGDIVFSWPIWAAPATLAAILALLRHPELAEERPETGRMPHAHAIFRASRISVGKYFNVTPAVRMA